MRCYNCGRELTNVNQCIYCGSNVSMYRKALIISNALYNDGLERAKSRDLSGAIEILNTSLRYNKENVIRSKELATEFIYREADIVKLDISFNT